MLTFDSGEKMWNCYLQMLNAASNGIAPASLNVGTSYLFGMSCFDLGTNVLYLWTMKSNNTGNIILSFIHYDMASENDSSRSSIVLILHHPHTFTLLLDWSFFYWSSPTYFIGHNIKERSGSVFLISFCLNQL